jgi:hypothetical protein
MLHQAEPPANSTFACRLKNIAGIRGFCFEGAGVGCETFKVRYCCLARREGKSEDACSSREIAQAISERWHFDGKYIEPIEEILPEGPTGCGGFQITVRRSHKTRAFFQIVGWNDPSLVLEPLLHPNY